MGSVDKRIEALERTYGEASPSQAAEEERARLLEEIRELGPAVGERAAAEEAEGNPARRIALDDLKARIERRTLGDGL